MDAARGLPSFSEMFNAFKTKRTLADSLEGGMNAFNESKAAGIKQGKEVADTQEATAHANYYNAQAAGGIEKKVNLAAMDDKARAALQPYADKDGNVNDSTAKIYLATTAQGQAADKANDTLDQKKRELEATTKHQAEMIAKDKEVATLREQLGQRGLENNAAQTVANVTSKDEPPTFVEKYLGSPILKAVTGKDTAAVISEKQKQAALQKLSETAQMAPQPQPQVTPSEQTLLNKPAAALSPAPAPAPIPRSQRHPGKPVPVYTEEDYTKLSPGQSYIDGSGKVKVKGR